MTTHKGVVMKHYFEVTYPKRLEKLRGELDKITDNYSKIDDDHHDKQEAQIHLFAKVVNHFFDNTKLHLAFKKDTMVISDMQYTQRLSVEYISEYFNSKGSKRTSLFYRALPRKKAEGE